MRHPNRARNAAVLKNRRVPMSDNSERSARDDRAQQRQSTTDPEASGAPGRSASDRIETGHAPGRETQERQAARRRAELRRQQRGEGEEPPRNPYAGLARSGIAERAFAALAENVRDYAVFLINADGIITFWGEGARLLKGWSRDHAEGAHLRLLYPDGGSEDGTAEAHLRESAERGEYTGEGHRVRGDGSTFWGGITLTALRDDAGELIGFAKVTRDLTARRAADAALRSAHQAAEEASHAKSLFLATISHEIRTPLNAIMSFTDLLEMEIAGPLTEKQRHQLSRIADSSQHLLTLVDDVLDFSRLEAGRLATRRTAMPLGPVVNAALSVVAPQAADRGVEVADAVSDFAESLWCDADEERVRQILLNLLINAIKFTEPGGRITISAGTAKEPPPDVHVPGSGPWVYVRVEDTGIGIPADRLQAIFEAFEQADMTHTRRYGGTGLGLAISRGLARNMEGDVTVRSESGAGSAFFLWLPAAPTVTIGEPHDPTARVAGPGARLMRQTRDAVLADLERVLHAYVARLRGDSATPSARQVGEAELEDHLATFLSDVAHTLGDLDVADGADSELLRDSTAIQRTIAGRHGAQRFRLGWGESEIRREFEILKEELAAAVRRRVVSERQAEVEDSVRVLVEFVARAEQISLASFRAAAQDPGS
jgi:PAS domain S-box-containing protein